MEQTAPSVSSFQDLRAHGGGLYSSELSLVECQAGLMKHSEEVLIRAEQQALLIFRSFTLLPMDSRAIRLAQSLVRSYRRTLGLRSLDAIHVATAQLLNEEILREPGEAPLLFLTADRRQFAAASAEGIMARLVA